MNRRQIIKQSALVLTLLALPFPLPVFAKFNNMADSRNFDVFITGGS